MAVDKSDWLGRFARSDFLWKLAETFLSCGDYKKLVSKGLTRDVPEIVALLEKIKAAAMRSGAKFNENKYAEFITILRDGKVCR